jgi:tetratricopeptide (TPR) repeat protein
MSANDDMIKAKQDALQLLQSNRLADAWKALEAVARLSPDDHEVWLNMGVIAAKQGDYDRAEPLFRRALVLEPDFPQTHFYMGHLLIKQNRLADALTSFQRYLQLQPDASDAHHQLAALYEKLGNSAAAEAAYREALRLDESNVTSLVALGRVLLERGEYQEARQLCERAIQLQPDAVNAYAVLITALRRQRCFAAALQCNDKLVELMPHMRDEYLICKAQMFVEQQHYEEALECYAELMRSYPDSVSAHWNYSHLLLLLGRYKEGWDEYEWRSPNSPWYAAQAQYGGLKQPLWNGESLAGRTILIHVEQGLGDAIQFGRYLLPLLSQAGRVIFHCHKELLGLFRRMPGLQVEEVDYNQARQQSFDYHLPLMSLARVMGTAVDSIPAEVPYLQADPSRVEEWRSRLDQDGFKVGLVWFGSKTNASDRMRSMKLSEYAPLAEIPGVILYSLQKGADAGELENFAEGRSLIDLAPHLHDFDDTAAVIENLDLVICVDTAVAHLAGALGRPVWILIYQPTEWRWLLGRDDSPWYPTMRLFRQTAEEPTWPPVISRVAAALCEQVAAQKKY